jgi:hypothetical protein
MQATQVYSHCCALTHSLTHSLTHWLLACWLYVPQALFPHLVCGRDHWVLAAQILSTLLLGSLVDSHLSCALATHLHQGARQGPSRWSGTVTAGSEVAWLLGSGLSLVLLAAYMRRRPTSSASHPLILKQRQQAWLAVRSRSATSSHQQQPDTSQSCPEQSISPGILPAPPSVTRGASSSTKEPSLAVQGTVGAAAVRAPQDVPVSSSRHATAHGPQAPAPIQLEHILTQLASMRATQSKSSSAPATAPLKASALYAGGSSRSPLLLLPVQLVVKVGSGVTSRSSCNVNVYNTCDCQCDQGLYGPAVCTGGICRGGTRPSATVFSKSAQELCSLLSGPPAQLQHNGIARYSYACK